MIFKHMLPGQDLILVRVETKTPPTRPLVARSTHRPRPEPEPPLTRFILWLLVTLITISGQSGTVSTAVFRAIRPARASWAWAIWANWAALSLFVGVLINVFLESVAAGYVQKMVGV